MTNKEKQLFVKALCGYLPYGIMCRIDHDPEGKYNIGIDDERFIDGRIASVCHENEQIFVYENKDYPYSPEEIRPYLRPMSSMSESERKTHINYINRYTNTAMFEWMNSRHFDYYGLIEKGLALEAPEGMYN